MRESTGGLHTERRGGAGGAVVRGKCKGWKRDDEERGRKGGMPVCTPVQLVECAVEQTDFAHPSVPVADFGRSAFLTN